MIFACIFIFMMWTHTIMSLVAYPRVVDVIGEECYTSIACVFIWLVTYIACVFTCLNLFIVFSSSWWENAWDDRRHFKLRFVPGCECVLSFGICCVYYEHAQGLLLTRWFAVNVLWFVFLNLAPVVLAGIQIWGEDRIVQRSFCTACVPKEYSEMDCPICLSPMEPAWRIISTNCNHIFHRGCVLEWMQQSKTCPICRSRLI